MCPIFTRLAGSPARSRRVCSSKNIKPFVLLLAGRHGQMVAQKINGKTILLVLADGLTYRFCLS
jgi:hypothetical protein